MAQKKTNKPHNKKEEEEERRQGEDQVSSAAQQEVKAVVQEPDVKSSTEGKNGRHTEPRETAAAAVPKSSVLSWFLVLSLLGVWSSVAVVYFDVVDYNSVIARAKEFRVNFSKVLQGKLAVYDADGDGDFDVEDAKVLLGLNKDGGGSDNGESLEEVLDILAEEGSDWFFGFFTFLYDLVAPPPEAELDEEEAGPPEEDETERSLKGAGLRKDRRRKDQRPLDLAPGKNHTKGLKERPASQRDHAGQTTGTNQDAPEAQAAKEKTVQPEGEGLTEAGPTETATVYGSEDVESAIQDAVPLPMPVEDNFVPDDPRDSAHPYDEQTNSIDTTGVLVEDPPTPETIEDSQQHLTSSKVTQQTDSIVEPVEGSQSQPTVAEASTEPGAEADEEKVKEKAKKKKPKLFNKLDKTIKGEIDAAEKLRKKGKVEEALRAFEALVQQYPQSPRALYGKAQCEDDLAERQRSNDMLQKAINTYKEASELPAATPDLLRAALKKRAERQQFLGRMRGSVATLERLVQIFPEDITLKNDLGVAYLLLGDNKGAKKVYKEVLEASPSDGFAKVHYGFILKSENQIAESIPYLKAGLESGDPGTDDGRFYFHLGDALQRVGDKSAYHWYELGHQRGHFASVWQRSLYNVKGLKAQPWWTPKETGYTDLVKSLERSWRTIREEAESVMNLTLTGLFVPEEENLRETGDWGQFTLWQQGRRAGDACRSVPKTCALLERFPEATGCKRGQIKFSVMKPGTHVWPHTGPTNCRLRMHLGLVVPKHGCSIRCTDQTRHWEEGKVLIFDDSFEHEVWQDADSYRLILIVDVWHPQLTAQQRQNLSPI